MAEVWMVRHAPVTISGVCYGQCDVPVAVAPDAAAEHVAARWAEARGHCTPELVSSPWLRAKDIAQSLSRHWGVELRTDLRLSELAFGAWEGRPFVEIERNDGERFAQWMKEYDSLAPPGGETVPELRARVSAWLDEARRSSSPVLAVTHAGVIRTARAIAAGLAYRDVVGQRVEHLCPERVA